MKLYRINIRIKSKLLEVFETGRTSLEAIATLYRRFPNAELVSHTFIRLEHKIKVDMCQICYKDTCKLK
jgi:hypothetical protein